MVYVNGAGRSEESTAEGFWSHQDGGGAGHYTSGDVGRNC